MSGKNIKVGLAEISRTQRWLLTELEARGLVTSETELSHTLAGRRHGPKAERVLRLAETIINEHRAS